MPAVVPVRVLGLLLEPAAVLAPVLVQELGLVAVPAPPLDRTPGGVPPSLVAALAPLPETAQEAES